jgi:hypothetical protein
MASTLHARFESSGILPVGTPKCNFCWQRSGTSPSHWGWLSDYPQLPRHLWTDAAVLEASVESHGGHFEHFVPSCITHRLNVSGHMLVWTFLLVLICGTLAQNLSTHFNWHRVFHCNVFMCKSLCSCCSCGIVTFELCNFVWSTFHNEPKTCRTLLSSGRGEAVTQSSASRALPRELTP